MPATVSYPYLVKSWNLEKKNLLLLLYWLVLCQLIQAIVIWEEGNSFEKMPPQDLDIGKLVGHFLSD